jgi:hypothetical protein
MTAPKHARVSDGSNSLCAWCGCVRCGQLAYRLLRFDFRLQSSILSRLEPGFRCVERILQCTVHRRIRPSVQNFSLCVARPANLPPRPAATVRSAVKEDVCLLGRSGFSNQCSETGRCPRRRVASPAVFPKMIRVEGGLQHRGAHARELKNTRGPSNTRARARGTPKCTRARAHAYTHTRTHAHARARARTFARAHTHARPCAHDSRLRLPRNRHAELAP